ncbi:hypothetical protein FH972_025884 [Carpinus fangiana]|uniref:Uncharacterized protein n=1 Tax=Carpinus fangiana TaxID=176857 RepID=A0A5N6L3A6_9ROSI|nr:hypothetical protein FH972_025884 [Carpinus fangiana]
MPPNEVTPARVVPAHLDFLAIYNPSLGPTDATEKDQIVFYWSKIQHDPFQSQNKDRDAAQTARDTANEQLRQVGLAQGVVHFARRRSGRVHRHREASHCVAGDRTRLVDPRVLPIATKQSEPDKPTIEYSAREVTPPALLLSQLVVARRIFELHHGPSLSDLYKRVKRTKFCNLLDIYWTTFARDWDVLLHGNPAADLFNGIKLAAGGELGMGVGEEDWGSGERDVLEDLVRNTEGLEDLIVSRFGHVAQKRPPSTPDNGSKDAMQDSDTATPADTWLGSLRQPEPMDGVVFTGVGALSRASLRSLSAWTSSIYTYGDDAYGILDNPTSGRRNRRRQSSYQSMTGSEVPPRYQRGNTDDTITEKGFAAAAQAEAQLVAKEAVETKAQREPPEEAAEKDPKSRQQDGLEFGANPDQSEADVPKLDADQNSAITSTRTSHGPSIPPPIVSAAEDALQVATEQAEEAAKRRMEQEKGQQESRSAKGYVGNEKWSKYLTLGYGSAWSIPGLQRETTMTRSDSVHPAGDLPETSSMAHRRTKPSDSFVPPQNAISDTVDAQTPSSNGRYLVGLKGNLDDPQHGSPNDSDSDESNDRLVLRTIHVGINVPDKSGTARSGASSFANSSQSIRGGDGSIMSVVEVKRRRVVVYINQPFIFTFIFDPSSAQHHLAMPSFFRTLHTNLIPLHKPLLASTSPSNVASRLSSFLPVPTPYLNDNTSGSPIFDLVYDPYNFTVHTSIPNIPLPGTLAAEGLGPAAHLLESESGDRPLQLWTRIEALSVHTQILNAYAETRRQDGDREHQAKTSRGWWVVWMRLTATSTCDSAMQGHGSSMDSEGFREAILIRRASDHLPAHRAGGGAGAAGQSRVTSGMLGRWGRDRAASEGGAGSLLEAGQHGGGSRGWGPSRITEGIGVDARKYVETSFSSSRRCISQRTQRIAHEIQAPRNHNALLPTSTLARDLQRPLYILRNPYTTRNAQRQHFTSKLLHRHRLHPRHPRHSPKLSDYDAIAPLHERFQHRRQRPPSRQRQHPHHRPAVPPYVGADVARQRLPRREGGEAGAQSCAEGVWRHGLDRSELGQDGGQHGGSASQIATLGGLESGVVGRGLPWSRGGFEDSDAVFRGDAVDDGEDFGVIAGVDDARRGGVTGFDDAGFVLGDGGDGVAEEGLVVEADVGDDGGQQLRGAQDVGRVGQAAHATLDDGDLHALAGEDLEGGGGEELEFRGADGLGVVTGFDGSLDLVENGGGDGCPVDGDAVPAVNKMWRSEAAYGSHAGMLESVREGCADGAFAIRAGDVDGPPGEFGPDEQTGYPLET